MNIREKLRKYKASRNLDIKIYFSKILSFKCTRINSMKLVVNYMNTVLFACNKDYYKKTIKKIKAEETTFFFIYEESERVIEILKAEDNIIFIRNQSQMKQSMLMKKCDDFIISNSSISRRGSFIGGNYNRIKIVLKKWDFDKEKISKYNFHFSNMMVV